MNGSFRCPGRHGFSCSWLYLFKERGKMVNQKVYDLAKRKMEEQIVTFARELEIEIYQELKDRLTDEDKKICNGKVEKWRNDIHWARANLTSAGAIETFNLGEDFLIVWLPKAGSIDGTAYVKYSVALKAITELVGLLR
jgi:hypothetical protein